MARNRKAEIGKKVGLGFLETVIHICVYLLVILIFIRAATLAYDFSYDVFGNPAASRYDQTVFQFEVPEGASAGEVADKLEASGLVRYSLAFRIKARLSKLENSIIPGTYELSPSMTSDEIMVILTTPPVDDVDAQAGEDARGEIETSESTGEENGDQENGEAGE